MGIYCLVITLESKLLHCSVFPNMPNCQWPIAKATFIELVIYHQSYSRWEISWIYIFVINVNPTGLLIFRGKKGKISRDFQGQIRGKIGRFRDFCGRKVKIRRKIGRFHGILAEKSQILEDFQGQILRKISRFHGKFQGGGCFANKQSVKTNRFRWIFFGKFR